MKSKGKSISSDEINKIAYDIASAIYILHKKSIIHRDLKPQNIFLDIDKEGKISLAKIGDLDLFLKMDGELTTANWAGDKRYITPENKEIYLLNEENYFYSTKTDIWCFGLILFYLLYKKEYFNFESKFLDKSTYNFEISPSLIKYKELYESCTSIDPDQRPEIEFIMQNPPLNCPKFVECEEPLYENIQFLKNGRRSKIFFNKSKEFIIKKVQIGNNEDGYYFPENVLFKKVEILTYSKNCASIVNLVDYYKFKNSLYLVEECCNGFDLEDYSNKNNHKFSLDEIRLIAKDIAVAIQFLHNIGISHNEVYQSNILIRINGNFKIINAILGGFLSASNSSNIIESNRVDYLNIYNIDQFHFTNDIQGFGFLLFFLAFGKKFSSQDEVLLKEKNYSLNLKNSNLNIDNSLYELINRCICEEKSRYSINEIMSHSFLQFK